MRIAAVAEALPPHWYDQATLTHYLEGVWQRDPQVARRLDGLHKNARVVGRHLALPLEAYAGLGDFTQTNAAWCRAALELGEQAAAAALAQAGLAPRDVDVLLSTTVTGIASPSLDARLMNRMGFRSDLKRVPMFGLGCVAGAAGVARAADFVRGDVNAVALVLAVELCSLTLQRDDRSLANLISSGLFGDGAAAAVVVGAGRAAAGPEVLAARSVFYPDTEDVMGWDVGAHGFRIVLSPAVPAVARERLPDDVASFLADLGVPRAAIANWVAHPGGPKVLEALQDGLGLSAADLRCSWECLQRCGNLSSASVLQVLAETMRTNRPAAGSLGLLLAMGPGFCSELVLLRW